MQRTIYLTFTCIQKIHFFGVFNVLKMKESLLVFKPTENRTQTCLHLNEQIFQKTF
jgi:hypothetical protein